VFHISIWGGLELCSGGLSQPKPPRGDGTELYRRLHAGNSRFVASLVFHCCAIKKKVIVASQLYDVADEVILWFINIELKQIFYKFFYYFWGQHFWWTVASINGNNFFVFRKFPLPSTFYCLPSSTDVLASLMLGHKCSFPNSRFLDSCRKK